MTLVVVDEPQQGANSAPLKLAVTNSDLVMFRLHGQNTKVGPIQIVNGERHGPCIVMIAMN